MAFEELAYRRFVFNVSQVGLSAYGVENYSGPLRSDSRR
jgi:hypothetical protein